MNSYSPADPKGLRRFTISVPDAELQDLADRLARTRLPSLQGPSDWSHGVPRHAMSDLLDYWSRSYDWRATEARLNALPQYLLEIEGVDIHVVHVRSPRNDASPLILTHGWPGAITEFEEIIGGLVDPGAADIPAFDVILPSLPGFGWSSPTQPPLSSRAIARLWGKLMVQLGYMSYFVQGGDWGGAVSAWLAVDSPERVRALHLNTLGLKPFVAPDMPLSEEESEWLAETRRRRRGAFGYLEIQSTMPLTLGYGLTDSPAGLAAWILEKFRSWSHVGISTWPFEIGRLLDIVMIYWMNRAAYPAGALYYAGRNHGALSLERSQRVTVPTAYLACPDDVLPPPPQRWVMRGYNCLHRRDLDWGGHFIAMERPDAFMEDLRYWFGG